MTREVILRVENLCQYFKLGDTTLKAVDNVSFEIKKGEVFGLVGESGCGKTTTGRSIIRLYDATSGNVWFCGQRIGAGSQSYKDNIEKIKNDLAEKTRKAENEIKENPNSAAEIKRKLSQARVMAETEIAKNKREIVLARRDQKYCDKLYSEKKLKELAKEYDSKIATASPMAIPALKKEYDEKCKIAKNSRLTTRIQMIFQDPIASLNPRMTVKEIIAEGLVIRGIKDKEFIEKEVYRMLETVGLVKEHAGRYPHEFSGGQRQRIGVARSIIVNPELIIADEPISALDVSIRAQVINLLNSLRDKLGISIMFIAHDLSVVKYFSDTIGVMYFGKMVERAPSNELFAHPFHPYTRSLLSAIPLPDPNYEKNRKRIIYNPNLDHDYSVDKPSFREISPEHFVLCNDAEFEQYRKALSNEK